MSDHVYKSVEITGSSPAGVKEAIDGAIAKASQTVRNLDWFEVMSIRGQIDEGRPLPGDAQDRLPAGGLRFGSSRASGAGAGCRRPPGRRRGRRPTACAKLCSRSSAIG
jgi:flavin-binding protein dodecin